MPIDISISDHTEAAALRISLRDFLWPGGYPDDRQPNTVTADVGDPIGGVSNLDQVDHLQTVITPETVQSWLFVPRVATGQLFIVHQGHNDDIVSNGIGRMIRWAMVRGAHVLGCRMPDIGHSNEPLASFVEGVLAFSLTWHVLLITIP